MRVQTAGNAGFVVRAKPDEIEALKKLSDELKLRFEQNKPKSNIQTTD